MPEETDVLVHAERVTDHPYVLRTVELLRRRRQFGIREVDAELRGRDAVFEGQVVLSKFEQSTAGGRWAVVRQEVLALGEVVEAETDRVRLHSAEARDTNKVSHSVADTVADCQLRKRFDAEEVDELEPAGVLELCRVGSVGRVVHRSDMDVTHDVQPCLLHVVDEVDEMTRCPRVCHHQQNLSVTDIGRRYVISITNQEPNRRKASLPCLELHVSCVVLTSHSTQFRSFRRQYF